MKNAKGILLNVFKYCFLSVFMFIVAFVAFFSFNFKKQGALAAPITVNISTPYDLYLFSVRVNNNSSSGVYRSANVYLLNDIDMSDLSSSYTFSCVGYHPDRKFTGVFDGQNHTIKNLSINGLNDRGLFGYSSGTIKNVIVYDGSITCNGGLSAGAIAGSIYGGTVTNCYNMGCDIYISQSSSATTGGIVGYVSGGSIVSCYNNASVYTYSLSGDSVTIKSGGIAGHLSSGASISGCQNKGTVDAGSTNMYTYSGGIVGYCEGDITNCLNTGTVKSYAKTTLSASAETINPLSLVNSKLNGSGELKLNTWDYVRQAIPGGDTYSSYSYERTYAYCGGLAGYQSGGTISYCINNATTNYASSGDQGAHIKYYSLYYRMYNNAGLNGNFYSLYYMDFTLRTNYYNTLVGQKTGGTLSNCYHPDKTTANRNKVSVDIYDYKSNGTKLDTRSHSDSNLTDYSNETWLTYEDYTSPQIGYTVDEDVGIDITVWERNGGDIFDLYTMSRPNANWISSCKLQSSTAMSTITDHNTTIWGYNGSTPKIKTFYWIDNVVKPA